jgi:hypothetical protein
MNNSNKYKTANGEADTYTLLRLLWHSSPHHLQLRDQCRAVFTLRTRQRNNGKSLDALCDHRLLLALAQQIRDASDRPS